MSWDYSAKSHILLFLFISSHLLSVQATSSTAVITTPTPTVSRDATTLPVDGMAATVSYTRSPSGQKAPWSYTPKSHISMARSPIALCSGHSVLSSRHHLNWEAPPPWPLTGSCLNLTRRSLQTCWLRHHQLTQMGRWLETSKTWVELCCYFCSIEAGNTKPK